MLNNVPDSIFTVFYLHMTKSELHYYSICSYL